MADTEHSARERNVNTHGTFIPRGHYRSARDANKETGPYEKV